MVTVLIATPNRPAFLRTALTSVVNQTARGRIAKVIVVENASGTESESVCAEFKNLPIVYHFRNPPVNPMFHLRTLLAETETSHVAILHDDDWWHPDHLAAGLRCLEEGETNATYWSSYFRVEGESSWLHYWNSSLWLGSGYQPATATWKLDSRQVLLGCLCRTPCHYSALIAPTQCLANAWEACLSRKNPFDNDRILALELAKLGPTYFNPSPQVFVREHARSDTYTFKTSERASWVEATTNYLIEESRKMGMSVKTEMDELLLKCPTDSRFFVYNTFEPGTIRALMKGNEMPPSLARYLVRAKIKRYVKAVSPNFVLQGLTSLARRLRNRQRHQFV